MTKIKHGDLIRNMNDDELANFLADIIDQCSYSGGHGNNINSDGNCDCDYYNCPLKGAHSIQKRMDSERIQRYKGCEVFCSKEAISVWLKEIGYDGE